MWIITSLILLAGGLLGAANLLIAKRPNARELIDKLVPFAGIIGIIMLLWGLRDLFYVLRSISHISHLGGFWWVIFLVTTLTELALGFLLGYGPIIKYVLGSSPAAVEKAERVRTKLAVYQGPLGLTAIVLAIIFFLMSAGRT